jgi:hypothetical protein
VEEIRKALQGATPCRVEIQTWENNRALVSARRLQNILGSCGFPSHITHRPEWPATGLMLRADFQRSAIALTLQSAFSLGGYKIALNIGENNPPNLIVISLGQEGLL